MREINIENLVRDRAERRIPWEWLRLQSIGEGFFAGSGLLKAEPNDVDLFPIKDKPLKPTNNDGIVSRTRNSDTFVINGKAIQLCHFEHDSLRGLVESFDFAHVKIGVRFKRSGVVNKIEEVYISDDFRAAMLAETSYYTGSAYPLSSLMRVVKYAKRGVFTGKSYIPVMIDIIGDIVSRGFESYEDFKDQLDAVDLGLLDKDFDRDALMRVYNALTKGEKR